MEIILMAIIVCCGALNIYNSITHFIRGEYFAFGIDIMLAIWMCALMVETVITT
jgi:hypothetical protein